MDPLLFVRMALTALSAFLLGYVLYVAWSYMRIYARALRDWRRLLPLHVWTIAVSYVVLLTYATVDMVSRASDDETLTWRLPLLAAADGLGVVAMNVIDKLRRARGNPIKAEDP